MNSVTLTPGGTVRRRGSAPARADRSREGCGSSPADRWRGAADQARSTAHGSKTSRGRMGVGRGGATRGAGTTVAYACAGAHVSVGTFQRGIRLQTGFGADRAGSRRHRRNRGSDSLHVTWRALLRRRRRPAPVAGGIAGAIPSTSPGGRCSVGAGGLLPSPAESRERFPPRHLEGAAPSAPAAAPVAGGIAGAIPSTSPGGRRSVGAGGLLPSPAESRERFPPRHLECAAPSAPSPRPTTPAGVLKWGVGPGGRRPSSQSRAPRAGSPHHEAHLHRRVSPSPFGKLFDVTVPQIVQRAVTGPAGRSAPRRRPSTSAPSPPPATSP